MLAKGGTWLGAEGEEGVGEPEVEVEIEGREEEGDGLFEAKLRFGDVDSG